MEHAFEIDQLAGKELTRISSPGWLLPNISLA